MDYPKSTPGIGLVDGRFVDENQTTGQPGSLIPAAWANALMTELLAVIKAAGIVPSEEDNAQLLRAIQTMAASDYKKSVRCATTGPIALSGLQTIDGVALAAGDRVLVKDQAAASQNWIYTVAAGPWVRAQDANESAECTPGHLIPVQAGTANKLTVWQLTNTEPPVIGATALGFRLVIGKQGTTLADYGITDAYTKAQTYSQTEVNELLIGVVKPQGSRAAPSNLRVSTTGSSSLVLVTADEVTVASVAGDYRTLTGVNVTINCANAGANGLDSGALQALTWYPVWIIWGPAGTAGVISLSYAAPTLPAGYTHRARVGAVPTDGTANKYPLNLIQLGRNAQYKIGGNVSQLPKMASGIQGNPVTPVWAPVSTAAFFPPSAAAVHVSLYCSGAATSTILAPSNTYGAVNATSNMPLVNISNSSQNANLNNYMARIVPEGANLYYASNAGVSHLSAVGWEDNL